MELFLIVALVWGGMKALDKGAETAAARGREAVRRYRSERPVPVPGQFGTRVGRKLGEGAHRSVETGRGFLAGVKAGWPEGKQAAYQWRDRRNEAAATEARRESAAVEQRWQEVFDSKCVECGAEPKKPCSDDCMVGAAWSTSALAERNLRRDREADRLTALAEPLLDEAEKADPETLSPRVRDELEARRYRRKASTASTTPADPWEQAVPVQSDTEDTTEETDVSTSTDTAPQSNADQSGEVTSYPQLIATLEQIEADAVDDLEDAQADKARAEADGKKVEAIVASLARLKLDQGSIGEVARLAEAAQARAKAATDRQAAAEQRVATAQSARETIKRGYEALYEASQAAPAVPEREFVAAG